MTVKNVMDVMPTTPVKGSDNNTMAIAADITDSFAARLGQAADKGNAGHIRKDDSKSQPNKTAENTAEPVELDEPLEEKDAPQKTSGETAVMTAIPIVVKGEQPAVAEAQIPAEAVGGVETVSQVQQPVTAETQDIQTAVVPESTETVAPQDAEAIPAQAQAPAEPAQQQVAEPVRQQAAEPVQQQAAEPVQPQQVPAQPSTKNEVENVNTQAPEQDTGKAAPQQQAGGEQPVVAIGNEADKKTLDFVKQAMGEAEALLNQATAANVEEKPVEATMALQDEAQAQTEAKGQAVTKADGKSADMENQPKAAQPQAQQPITASIAPDGKVEFKTSGMQEAPLEQAAPPEPVSTQIVSQVRTMVSANRTELTLQLKPDHLGGLSIILAATEEKGLVAKLMTSSKEVHEMIQNDMAQMQQVLRDRGINVVQMEVIYNQMADATNKQGTNEGQGWSESAPGGQGRAPEGTEAAAVASSYGELSTYEVLAEQGGSVEFSA